MTWTTRALCLLALLAPASRAAPQDEQGGNDPMAAWKPPVVKHEAKDRQEITALLKKMDAAGKKGDLEAATALVDFPVLMTTDDSKGEASSQAWEREQWTEMMKPFYEQPMAGMQMTHKPEIFVVTDSLATVDDRWTMTMGNKKVSGRSSMLVVRVNGQWKVKSMVEGGWGDMKMEGAPAGSGSGGQGSGSKPAP